MQLVILILETCTNWRYEKMLEHLIQGIALAGGVEVASGRSVLPPRQRVCGRPGPLRRAAGMTLALASIGLERCAARLLSPVPRYRVGRA